MLLRRSGQAVLHGWRALSTAAPADHFKYNPRNVVRVLHRVQEILGAKVEFPRIVMVGDQSSGKTSVIEALIGEDISCKDSTMATRRPLLLSLIRTSREAMKARFGDGETVYSFEAVKQRIVAENDVKNTGGLDISDHPIELTIYSKDVFDTILVDLPGFVTIPQMDQADDLPDQIMSLNLKYLQDPNSILAVVTPATVDPSTSLALREARKADKTGQRSIGVVTKIDLTGDNKEALLRLLQNSVFPMGHGRVGIRCRIQQEQIDGVSFDTAIEREAMWINANPDVRDAEGVMLGIPLMRMKLSDLLVQNIMPEIPTIVGRLDTKIEKSRENGSFLERLSKETNMSTVSKELDVLTSQLHPASDARQDFEAKLRRTIFNIVDAAFSEAGTDAFEFDHVKPSEFVSIEGEFGAMPRAIPAARGLLAALDYTRDRPMVEGLPRIENISKFRDLLVFGGQGHFDGMDQSAITRLRDRGIEIGAQAAYFEHMLPTNPRRARTQWNQGLNKTIDRVMLGSNADTDEWTGPQEATEGDFTPNKGLVGEIFNGLIDELTQMSDDAKTKPTSGSESNLAKLYFRFLLNKIANRINEESMEQELIGMIERERRPVCDFLELQNELSKSAVHPRPFTPGFFSANDLNTEVLRVELFNESWTEAYLRLASKRVSDDVFRILSIRLLEPLVFECIQYSLNLFSAKGSIGRESEQEKKRTEELMEIKEVLMKTYEVSTGYAVDDAEHLARRGM
jgi:GTPase SAR1 family protein